jgi:hypothetical protein
MHIGDFTRRNERDSNRAALARLLRDFKAERVGAEK